MIFGTKKKYVENVFNVKHSTFERINSFVYLGTLVTTSNNTSAEINNRITLANRSYFGLVNILKAKNINQEYKVIIYKTLIKPILMFGAETWLLSEADELRLGVFERKILRRIYGPNCEGATWRPRYRVIHKSLRDFRTRLRNNQDRHGRKEHINRPGRPVRFAAHRQHSAGIHVPFTNCFVCRWFCVVHDPKPPLHSHN